MINLRCLRSGSKKKAEEEFPFTDERRQTHERKSHDFLPFYTVFLLTTHNISRQISPTIWRRRQSFHQSRPVISRRACAALFPRHPEILQLICNRLYETGDWSDLTLETATRSFKVHKAILCPASPFFDAVCRNGSEESNAGIIYLTESELVIDAALRHIYQQPIDWLRYHAEDLRDMVEKGCSALVIEFGSMVLSDTTPSDDGLSINAVWSRLSNILDLESAACKVCASSCPFFDFV